MGPFNILIVDDDPNIRKLLYELLTARPGYQVMVAVDGKEAVRFFAERKIDVVLTDIHMPGFTGIEMVRDMKKIGQRYEILVMTANATPENVEKARQVGARSILLKPFDNLDLIEAEVDKAVRAATENRDGDEQPPVEEAAQPAPPDKRTVTAATPVASAAPAPARPAATAPEPPPDAPAPATPVGADPGTPPRPKAATPRPQAALPVAPAPDAPQPDSLATTRLNMDEIEAFKADLSERRTREAGDTGHDEDTAESPTSPRLPEVAPQPARSAAPPAESAPGAASATPIAAGGDIPEIDAWKADLVGNETPDLGGFQARGGGGGVIEETPEDLPRIATQTSPAASSPDEASGDGMQTQRPVPSEEEPPRRSAAAPRRRPGPASPPGSRLAARRGAAPQPTHEPVTMAPDPRADDKGRGGGLFSSLKARLFGSAPGPDSSTRTRSVTRPSRTHRPTAELRQTVAPTPAAESPERRGGPGFEQDVLPEAAVPEPDTRPGAVPSRPIAGQHRPADIVAPAARVPEPVDAPAMPAELESIFSAGAQFDTGRMKMQVPVVCLQTWEEGAACAALQRMAATLQREFYAWSVTRGLARDDGHPMGDIYRDPVRALEFIRRHRNEALYVLADFRKCLDDRMVVRVLREMFMEGETARAMIVLTAPVLPIPPELQPACASFDWPAPETANAGSLLDEVRAELEASSGQPVEIDAEMARLLAERVKEMPAGRARFEIARALMARMPRGV